MIDRCAIVILGASGDLARRKLIPALDKLYRSGSIGGSCIVVGCGRSAHTTESFRRLFNASGEFTSLLWYHREISGLKQFIESKGAFGRIVFFMALPPEVYSKTAEAIVAEGFGRDCAIIIEKPFGRDYESSRTLNVALGRHFTEDQIYRNDHYLGKEAVQNILVFRFANTLFEPTWNSAFIESIQISGLQTAGVEERGAYFDRAGIVRDMIQNHLTQLLCLLTMDPPVSLSAEHIRVKKIEILRALTVKEHYRLQYLGYRSEKNVAIDSKTETFAQMTLFIDNERWKGMPVFLRSGKGTARDGTDIAVTFKRQEPDIFKINDRLSPNRIVFKIQPGEGIILDMSTKRPGTDAEVVPTSMSFCYHDSFTEEIPEAYQRLLRDALTGNQTLFVGAQESEAAWKVYEPILDKGELGFYKKGTTPEGCIKCPWADFEKYNLMCGMGK
jgi:glucose-6-phosphate 1-dehydrogenase